MSEPLPQSPAAPSELEAPSEMLFSPAEVYHENSKLYASDLASFARIGFVVASPEVRQVITRPFTRLRGYPRVELRGHFAPSTRSFEAIVQGRRSVREFSGEAIGLDALAKIFQLGDGVSGSQVDPDGNEWLLRTAPSGGGLFPIELSCIVRNVEGLAPGVYLYDAPRSALIQLREADLTGVLQEATYLPESVATASACVLLSAVMPRTRFKYGERSYRFALLEAGHIAQNLLLAAEAEGLAAVPVGGFLDTLLNDLLELDGCEEIVLYLVLIGRRRGGTT